MNKDEKKMIKDMAMIIAQADRECLTKSDDCGVCNAWGKEPCACYNEAEALYNANYRKIADDEIVIKKSDYETLKKDYAEWKDEYDHNCLLRLEVFELEKQLEQAKQETKKILQEIKKEIEDIGDWQPVYDEMFARIANRHGIELE